MNLKREILQILLPVIAAGISIALGLIFLDGMLRNLVVSGSYILLIRYLNKNTPDKVNLVNALVVSILVVSLFIWLVPRVVEINDYRAVLGGICVVIAFIIPVAIYFFSNRNKDLF